jgi:hypothetical protein
VVGLLLESATAEQKTFVLAKPREALKQAGAAEHMGWDPRLSKRGNRVSKQLTVLLDRLVWIRNFLIPSRNSAPMSSICRALAEGVLIRVFPSKRITKAV